MNDPTARPLLRHLPLPAKLVVSLFLLSVGLGYVSAMVQLHFQHAPGTGQPLPGLKQVVAIFHGDDSQKKSQMEQLIEGPPEGNWPKNMTPAFFSRAVPCAAPDDEERDGERKALLAWIHAGAPKDAYDDDAFPVPRDWGKQPITKEFRDSGGFKVRSLLQTRCVHCHNKTQGDVDAQKYPLETYEQVAKYAKGGGGPAMSLEKLTQSTHAHLLSFSMLYALTGLAFAFSSYPLWARATLAPLALLAQVIDIGCWWLARLPGPVGVGFALAITVTGGIVAVSLGLQIILSLFDMYDRKGKAVLCVLFALAGAGGVALYLLVLGPFLIAERTALETKPGKSRLEKMIQGPQEGNWKKNMAPAFFSRSEFWKTAIKDRPEAEVRVEREGERKALIAWLRAGAPEEAYKNDALPLPEDWGDQPITKGFLNKKDGTLNIRTILEKRCVRCHAKEDGDPEAQSYPLETYEEVLKYARP